MSNPVFIIGGGESLRGFDFSLLDGHATIGTNASAYFYPSDYLFVQDNGFLKSHDLSFFKGEIVRPSANQPFGNAGFGAILHAIKLGFSPIYLLGFDMQCKEFTHFHDKYSHELESRRESASKQLELFNKHADIFKGHEIYSIGNTALNLFPNLNLEDVFQTTEN